MQEKHFSPHEATIIGLFIIGIAQQKVQEYNILENENKTDTKIQILYNNSVKNYDTKFLSVITYIKLF